MSLFGAGPVVLQGRLNDAKGKAVPGAEIRLLDSAGKLRHRVFSDITGQYRFPAVTNIPDGQAFRLKISHRRFKNVQTANPFAAARLGSSQLAHLKPGDSVPMLLATKALSLDFVLEASPEAQNVPIEPNELEYYYQRGLLHLGRNEKSDALKYLAAYAQLGHNLRQVERAIQLILQNQ
jgi:hypothetical protein